MTSSWSGFDVIIVPDDDKEAAAMGLSAIILHLVTTQDIVFAGGKVYARASVWERMVGSLSPTGTRH